jgi:hypothetical protein
MEYYSVKKKNEIFSFASKCMELELMLSEVSQIQKDKGHLFSLICRRFKKKYIKIHKCVLISSKDTQESSQFL